MWLGLAFSIYYDNLCLLFGVFKPHLFLFFLLLFLSGGSSLLHSGFLQLQRAGATCCCSSRASHCGGFPCCGAQALGHIGFSSRGSQALEHKPSSCGTQAKLLHCVWDLPGPGIEPPSLALQGGFLTTGPPGKPPDHVYFLSHICWLIVYRFIVQTFFSHYFFIYFKKQKAFYLFIWLHGVLVVAWGFLVFWPGIEPWPPALGAWNSSHWTTREVLFSYIFIPSSPIFTVSSYLWSRPLIKVIP